MFSPYLTRFLASCVVLRNSRSQTTYKDMTFFCWCILEKSILNVTEIYQSIQGEARYAGHPCVFVRLAGCPLRCRWCDTVYSFKEGKSFSIGMLVDQISAFTCHCVEITGGEPLAQPATLELIQALCDRNMNVMIETGGSEPIEGIDRRCHIIMDLKAPGSAMEARNRYENIHHLKSSDEIKVVIADRNDFDWLEGIVAEKRILDSVDLILCSPAFGLCKERDLVDWMLNSSLKNKLKLNLQWHKYIWSPRTKGV